MTDDHNFEHLPLPLSLQGKPKLHGGGRTSTRTRQNTANRKKHGGYITQRSAVLSKFWKDRREERKK